MAYSGFFWWAVILVILGIILLIAAGIWFAAIRKSEWYIWLLLGLGALFLIIGIILFIWNYSRTPSVPVATTSGCGVVRTVAAPQAAVYTSACPTGAGTCGVNYAPGAAVMTASAPAVLPAQQVGVAHTVQHNVGHALVGQQAASAPAAVTVAQPAQTVAQTF